jgi:hypothetical protein
MRKRCFALALLFAIVAWVILGNMPPDFAAPLVSLN